MPRHGNRAGSWGAAIRRLALGLALVPWAVAPAAAHSLENLEKRLFEREIAVEIVNREAPAFALRDADGTLVRLADYRGKVVVLNFVYTKCPDVCPLHSESIAAIQEAVNRTPMKGLVRFVTVSTDPVRDTPVVMKAYGERHGLDPVNWVFLGADADEIGATRAVAERYGLKFTAGKDGTQMHGVVTHLIDKSGNLRARYHGLKFKHTNMIVHINALTNDFH